MLSLFNNLIFACKRLTALVLLVGITGKLDAQVCADPVNVVYGLTNAGFIYPVNVNTGDVGTAVNTAYPGNAPDQSNGLSYNPVNGKFYYFKRIPSSTITEFVSFDPSTNSYTILNSPSTTSQVFSGSITNDGTGYYCWDTQGKLFYYAIATDTWTTITTSLVDQYGKDVDSIIRAHTSGDGAIDGNGNLWILPSSDTRFGLFRLNAPLPTTPVASITVEEIVSMTPPPAKFVGIAFTVSGEIFMCAGDNGIYRLEDDLSLTFMSTMSTNMGDLTSCNFPLAVLASGDMNFTAVERNGNVHLSWKSVAQPSVKYVVERSTDNNHWSAISNTNDLEFELNRISFTDVSPVDGKYFYRIKIAGAINGTRYSPVKYVRIYHDSNFSIWPNPVKNSLFIRNENNNTTAIIFSPAGQKLKLIRVAQGINSIDLSSLARGRYIISLYTDSGNTVSFRIIKQ